MQKLRIRVEAIRREPIDYERLIRALVQVVRDRQQEQDPDASGGDGDAPDE